MRCDINSRPNPPDTRLQESHHSSQNSGHAPPPILKQYRPTKRLAHSGTGFASTSRLPASGSNTPAPRNASQHRSPTPQARPDPTPPVQRANPAQAALNLDHLTLPNHLDNTDSPTHLGAHPLDRVFADSQTDDLSDVHGDHALPAPPPYAPQITSSAPAEALGFSINTHYKLLICDSCCCAVKPDKFVEHISKCKGLAANASLESWRSHLEKHFESPAEVSAEEEDADHESEPDVDLPPQFNSPVSPEETITLATSTRPLKATKAQVQALKDELLKHNITSYDKDLLRPSELLSTTRRLTAPPSIPVAVEGVLIHKDTRYCQLCYVVTTAGGWKNHKCPFATEAEPSKPVVCVSQCIYGTTGTSYYRVLVPMDPRILADPITHILTRQATLEATYDPQVAVTAGLESNSQFLHYSHFAQWACERQLTRSDLLELGLRVSPPKLAVEPKLYEASMEAAAHIDHICKSLTTSHELVRRHLMAEGE